jgi:hypothetical protein
MAKNNGTRKLSGISLDKKLAEDGARRNSFLIKREGMIEFKNPEENNLNRFLMHDRPFLSIDNGRASIDGPLGIPLFYYFDPTEYERVIALFKRFEIPEPLFEDLLAAFLSLVFAETTAAFKANFHHEMAWKQKEASQVIELLAEFAADRKLLREVSLGYREILEPAERNKRPVLGKLITKKIKGHIAIQFIEKVLQAYKSIEAYEIQKKWEDMVKEYGVSDPNMGYKNPEKLAQSYYASVIFDYLTNNLYNTAFDLLGKPDEYEKEVIRLKKLYSHRKVFQFIGELMILSGLLNVKEGTDKEDIIEVIEKKLVKKLRGIKKRIKEIEENNKKSVDGKVEAVPFHWFF